MLNFALVFLAGVLVGGVAGFLVAVRNPKTVQQVGAVEDAVKPQPPKAA